jgi:hypothetical protein
LEGKHGKGTVMGSLAAAQVLKPDEEGKFKGRDSKGNPIKARIGGKSLARRLMEEQAVKGEKKGRKKKRRGRQT